MHPEHPLVGDHEAVPVLTEDRVRRVRRPRPVQPLVPARPRAGVATAAAQGPGGGIEGHGHHQGPDRLKPFYPW